MTVAAGGPTRPVSCWGQLCQAEHGADPWEHNTDLKITKRLHTGTGQVDVFAEIFNLFNTRVFHYNRVFLDSETLRRYEDGQDIEYALPDSNNPDLAALQTFRIYNNAPRSIRFGVVVHL